MKQKLFCSILLLSPLLALAQVATFSLAPYIDGITTIKDGQIEAGPELKWQNTAKGKAFSIRPSVRMPLTDKDNNVIQIDRFSSAWRGILSIQGLWGNTGTAGSITRHAINGQFEYGSEKFKYYPTGNKNTVEKENGNSYAFEIKYIAFFMKGNAGAKQFSPQFRLRYSYNWKAADKVGVVNPSNANGVITTTDMVIGAPGAKPAFSPAFSLQFYPGRGDFSFSPTLYYDFIGKNGNKKPFGNLNRLRLESWIFFYPAINQSPNVKLGVTPFLSVRTKGADDFNKIEYGAMVTLKVGTSFLQFF